jgi:hypothetical protein
VSHLEDLGDDRRAGKAGLPADDRDVTNGLVVPDDDSRWDGKPWCVQHGAMNRIDPLQPLYRCQMCGVGARFISSRAEWYGETIKVGPEGEHDEIREFGRDERVAKRETEEEFRALLNREDELPEPEGAFEVFHDVTVRFRWSEIFKYGDGVMDDIEHIDDDTIGTAIDAYLEPRYDTDVFEVVDVKHRIEHDDD